MKRFWGLLALSPLSASVPIVCEPSPEPYVQFSESTYRAGWDIDMSPFAGGEDLLFAHRCIERTEGWLISKSSLTNSKATAARVWRVSELVFGWLPLNYLAIVAQHEIFGHGYRIRDLSDVARVNGYGFGTPPPYGPGGGMTDFDISSRFTTTDQAAVCMGGVESTAILALLTKYKWLERRTVDPRQSILYLLGQYDLPLYIGTIKETSRLTEEEKKGHDLIDYVRAVNYTYTAGHLHQGTLRSLSWINLADPFTYYAIYAWFHYVSTGRETHIPMIPIGQYGYLPGIRLGLTPFGQEYFLEHFISCIPRVYYVYVKAGWHAKNTYVGAGFYAPKIVEWKSGSIGARLDGWWQPKLLEHPGNTPFLDLDLAKRPNASQPLYPLSQQHATHLGLGLSLIGDWKLSERSGLEAELGYKSAGFVPGESLFAAPIARAYYTLLF